MSLILALLPSSVSLPYAFSPLPLNWSPAQALSTSQTPTTTTPKQAWPDWLDALRAEALTKGISQATVDLTLKDLTTDPVVLERDRAQPELTQTLEQYVDVRLSKKTLLTAQTMADDQAPLLERIRQEYGVPGGVMVAIWGLESSFGQITGSRPTIASLATLAYDHRRPALFRSELFQALAIVDRGLVAPADLKGSWAGAMGQPQFMPSSYLKHAVDFDGDGRADIWTSRPDVFASMANYLKVSGWAEGERWGREVRITGRALARIEKAVPNRMTGCGAVKDLTVQRTLDEWTELGVTRPDGDPLPASATMKASLVRGQHRYFLVYRNYEALLAYNCSNSYAISVGLLADTIETRQ
jgi:membrane-bound lytic murein transglycosylase B